MGQKVNPLGIRLGITRDWVSKWYAGKKQFPGLVHTDFKVREFLKKRLIEASVSRVMIERAAKKVNITIQTARPGIVIGKKGAEIEKLKAELNKLMGKETYINIIEVRRPDIDAQLVADADALVAAFDAACDAHDVAAAVRATLAFNDLLVAWSRDSAGDGTLVRLRETYHALIVRLGSLVPADAAIGVGVPDAIVDLLVERRTAARAAKEWVVGDRIRDALTDAGIELHDTPGGTTWERRPAG